MRICGREFGTATIAQIKGILETDPSLSRRGLSRRVCELLDWRAVNGKLQEVSCRKALLELDRRGVMRLPAAQEFCFRPLGAELPQPLLEVESPPPALRCTLEELGEIGVVAVSSRYSQASRIWNELMQRWHYLGKGPLCGAQIRYLLESSRHGWVGALAFSAAQWRLQKRDQYIEWSEAARRAHLHQVVGNSRFLILPGVQVPNLASRALALSLARLGKDWRERYGYAPVLAETFVDGSRFAGTCYRAANWHYVGQTAARSTPYANGKRADGPKDIYVYPLRTDWRQVLRAEPEVALGSTPPPEAGAPWTEEEFGRVRFFDARLKQRLYQLAADFAAQPGELIPQAVEGSAAKTKAAYRFFHNPQVKMKTLLRPHIESTIERLRAQPVILAVQDTTTLNYTAHPAEGVGPINTTQDGGVGLILHSTLAFTPQGTPLGLLDVQCWARAAEEAGKRETRHARPIAEKESRKWLVSYRAVAEVQKLCPQTRLISVGDREADLYELFQEAASEAEGPGLLVRAERSRNRRVEAEEGREQQALWSRLESEPLAGRIEVAVPRRPGRPARTAKLEVRWASVTLAAPRRIKAPPLRVWAVYAREVEAPTGVPELLEWMLLTTVETESFEQAGQRLSWYCRRWGIEVYHRTLKSGCRIEDRRLEDADSLEACLAIDLVVGWRVYWLTQIGREKPDTPCAQILQEEEWRVLSAWATGQRAETAPSTQQAIRWMGKLGGWLARGKQDYPGTTCVWRGLVRLQSMAQGYLLALNIHAIRAGPDPQS